MELFRQTFRTTADEHGRLRIRIREVAPANALIEWLTLRSISEDLGRVHDVEAFAGDAASPRVTGELLDCSEARLALSTYAEIGRPFQITLGFEGYDPQEKLSIVVALEGDVNASPKGVVTPHKLA